MNIFASDILFYVFGALAVILSLMVVFMRNPVSSALMMALSFGATAAVMIGLGAHFLGILQILVYAGAIMVLFAFIIMLLNVKLETSPFRRPVSVAVGVIIAGLFLGQRIGGQVDLMAAHQLPAAHGRGHDDLHLGAAQQVNHQQGFAFLGAIGKKYNCLTHLYRLPSKKAHRRAGAPPAPRRAVRVILRRDVPPFLPAGGAAHCHPC